MSNEKQTEALGMSYNRAIGRLHKMALLELLQRVGEDWCFRCGMAISEPSTISIEHKTPWMGDSELFWDLNNIAWSHSRCNSLHGMKLAQQMRWGGREVRRPAANR